MIRRWVWILVGLAVVMVMDLCGWLWLGGYGILFFIFLGLWCSNAMVVVVVVVVAAVDLWVVVGWWCCGVVIFFIILINYCKIMIILIGQSATLDFPVSLVIE